jgi:23S rRNA (guanine2445-N2)-methyltransferase / 23S rRNA (guanine2069-N7)-methyltransferase
MPQEMNFFATSVRYLETLLAEELRGLGADSVRETRAGVSFSGSLETAYRACLWSRVASRILLPIKTFSADSPAELYECAAALNWSEHLSVDNTLAVDCALSGDKIRHTRYAAQRVKDAVVDHFRARTGRRPSVSVQEPDIRLNLHVQGPDAVLSLDLSGGLHRRAYRLQAGEAPLKENIAAAVLLRARWPRIAAAGGAFLDPMCGSGTLCIEAALMAADCPPGLLRGRYGFSGWRQHDAGLWELLLREGQERFAAGREKLPTIVGCDHDRRAVAAARENVRAAGLEGLIRIERRELEAARPPGPAAGLVALNPPYGERLEAGSDLPALYGKLGRVLKEHFDGWQAAVLTGHLELAKSIGLRAGRRNRLYNGAIKCTLVHIEINEENRLVEVSSGAAPADAGPVATGSEAAGLAAPAAPAAPEPEIPPGPGAEMFVNRLRRNRRLLRRWLRKEGISCYRLYDADCPEYAVAIDIYEDRWAHVQEYAPPATVDPRDAERRRAEVLRLLPAVLEIDPENVYFKTRRRQRGSSQYGKQGQAGTFEQVREDDCRFLVNFSGYLDTGLFLDHRLTRHLIRELADGRSFLNLFCYTGTATVCAARGGAPSSVSVDSSSAYLEWAAGNLKLNGITGGRHRLERADCLQWLHRDQGRYGLIFVDPPTFSNSRSSRRVFEVQRDHVELIMLAAQRLAPGGILLFSCNYRKFKLDSGALAELEIKDLTEATRPRDFSRRRPHVCYKITLPPPPASAGRE